MTERKDEKWLDEQLRRTVNGPTPVFDAQAWKQKYASAYGTLTGRSQRRPTVWVLRGPAGKIAIAAAVVIGAAVLLIGRSGTRPPTRGPGPVAQEAPAQMVSMISLSAAFRQGGIEGLDKQCDRALETLGPRPTVVLVHSLFKDINGKG